MVRFLRKAQAAGGGSVPRAQVLGQLLPVAEQVGGLSVSKAERLKELEIENSG